MVKIPPYRAKSNAILEVMNIFGKKTEQMQVAADDGTSEAYLSKLTPVEAGIRLRFVNEYMFDWDCVKAAIRVGYPKAKAREIAEIFMSEPVVQRLISEQSRNFDAAKNITLGYVVSGLVKEANREGAGSSHAARVAAWEKTAKILGLGAANTVDNNVNLSGVMVVPAPLSPDDWEKTASKSQADLKADVTN